MIPPSQKKMSERDGRGNLHYRYRYVYRTNGSTGRGVMDFLGVYRDVGP